MPLVISAVTRQEFAVQIPLLRAAFTGRLDPTASAFRVLNSIEAVVNEAGETDRYIVGMQDDGVAALMIISGGMMKKIDELVAKPGNGSQMVEYAMTFCNGRASLDSFDTDSTAFWGKVGFIRSGDLPAQAAQGGCKMRLDCATSGKWEHTAQGWRIVRAAVPSLPIGFQAREPQLYSGLGVGRKESTRP